MARVFAFVSLISLALLVSSIDGRKDPGEYWRKVVHDQPMPEAIEGRVHVDSVHLSKQKMRDCNTIVDHEFAENKPEKQFANKDFEPRPNISIYHDDSNLKKSQSFTNDDFEPRPNISAYNDDAGLKEEKPFVEDFEPRPNISIYHD